MFHSGRAQWKTFNFSVSIMKVLDFMNKFKKALLIVPTIICCFISYYHYKMILENNTLSWSVTIYEAENRLLEQELNAIERKPSYDDGCRDTIVKIGLPNAGCYRDGWIDATKIIDGQDYSRGYHQAIAQFGYQTNNKELIGPPESLPDMKKEVLTAKNNE